MSTSNAGNLQGSKAILFASVYFCITKTFSCCGGLQQSPHCEILTIQGTIEKENWREISLLQVVGSPCEPSQGTDAQMPDVTTSQHSCCPTAAGAGHFARKEITSPPLVGFQLVCRWLWCDEKAPPFPKQFLIPLLYQQELLPHWHHVFQGAGGCWANLSALPRQQDVWDEQGSGYNQEIIGPLVYGPVLALCQERILLSYVQDH